jgi:hypothetical protein
MLPDVVDDIQDAVVADADAIPLVTVKLLAARGPGIVLQPKKAIDCTPVNACR